MVHLVILTVLVSLHAAVGSPVSRPLPYYLLEEIAANTPIGNIAIDAKLSDVYTPDTLRQLDYRISRQVDERGRPVELFAIDSRTSIMKTRVQIDRDVICPHQDSCLVYLDIEVSGPVPQIKVIQATVDILDINDHAPSFPSPLIYRTVLEPAAPGTTVPLPAARDPDSTTYGVQRYELVSSSHKFQLLAASPTDGSQAIVIKERLDREQANYYQIRLIAYDGGKPAKSGSVLVNLQVEDTNDNDPKFENATYEVYVLENTAAGTIIGRVNARDLDFGENAVLTYNFTDQTQHKYGNLFGMNPETGTIYLKASLDFEMGSTYLLTVMAHDHGPHSLPAHATVIVRVEDANDHAPRISVNTRTLSGRAILGQDSPVGTFVAHVSVEDMDGGDNGRVRCILDDLSSALFELQANYQTQYNIVTSTSLAGDSPGTLTTVVTCTDLGNNPLTATATFDVKITDTNNHPPTFSQRVYTATMEEANIIGDIVTMVSASDPDEGQNGQVRYSLHPDTGDEFSIDSEVGIITVNVELDREVTHTMDIKVLAHDLGSPASLSATATVLLTIVDVDDEPPVFEQAEYAFGTYENQLPNSEVGSVKASDKDGVPFNRFQYKIHGDEGHRIFSIDTTTGFIYTKQPLDRETQPVYYMTVLAQGLGSHLSGTTSVTVYVADKNDNPPYISWPTETNNTVFASSALPKDHVVARILASDQDLGNNGKLVYSIVQGGDGLFEINPGSGVITVARDLPKTAYKTYKLNILVKDQGFPEMMLPTFLNIVVNSSIAYVPEPLDSSSSFNNTTIVASLTSASLLLVFLLVVAIVLIKKQAQEKKEKTYAANTDSRPELPAAARRHEQTQNMLREDVLDGREANWTRQIPRTQHSLQPYYEHQPEIIRDTKLTIEDNDINLQVESKLQNNDNTIKKPPVLTLQDILKPSQDPNGTLAATFQSLTSPRSLTLASPAGALDDPVLNEVAAQHTNNHKPGSSPSAASVTSRDTNASTNVLLSRDFNDVTKVSNA